MQKTITKSKSSFLRSVLEEIRFHLVGTGYNYEPEPKHKNGQITPEHEKKIKKAMKKNQQIWDKRNQ